LEPSDEKIIVKQLIEGDEKAFRTLFDYYCKQIYAYGFSILKSKVHAEEIVQDVFLKVWLHKEKLNSELSFKSFLFTITRNLAFNFLKKALNDSKLKEELFYKSQKYHTATETQIQDSEYDMLKKTAIESLPPKRKRVFELSRDEEKSYEEIGLELGISVSTVKTQMSKALQSIRNFIKVNSDFTFAFVLFCNEITKITTDFVE
jgi:RNA polymerase sigma-70 factor (family 1)